MKLNPKVLAIISTLTLTLAGVLSLNRQKPLPACIELMKEHAQRLETKTIAPNPDGGYFVVFDGKNPGQLEFVGYVGPKSVDVMREQMADAGLRQIRVETNGTCEIENGLVYTLVSGSYIVPTQKPDPI
jgi:hypothetical protein